MKVIVPHYKSQQEVIVMIDRAAGDIFAGAVGSYVEIIDQKTNWEGPTMSFSFTARLGFISLPLWGTVEVDERHAIIDCELPPLVRNFVGEEKVRAGVEEKLKGLVGT